jgi:hypothetical protein
MTSRKRAVAKKVQARKGDRLKRDSEPGRQRRVTGDASETPKALRETRLRQRY